MLRVALLVAVVACAKDSGGASCRLGSTCEEYSAAKPEAQHDCEVLKGQWATAACPTEKLIGTCTTSTDNKRRYYGHGTEGYSMGDAVANCEHEFHGTWSEAK